MVLESDEKILRGVVCIFCGTHTALPVSNERPPHFEPYMTPESFVSLVRCRLCLREAPYGPKEIVAFRNVA